MINFKTISASKTGILICLKISQTSFLPEYLLPESPIFIIKIYFEIQIYKTLYKKTTFIKNNIKLIYVY